MTSRYSDFGGFVGLGRLPPDARTAITFALSPGNDHDAPQGRALLEKLGPMPEGIPPLMDKAYEDNETRQLVLDLGMIPVVRPKSNRIHPWECKRALYKKRNEIERLFRRLKGFRRIFSRFKQLGTRPKRSMHDNENPASVHEWRKRGPDA